MRIKPLRTFKMQPETPANKVNRLLSQHGYQLAPGTDVLELSENYYGKTYPSVIFRRHVPVWDASNAVTVLQNQLQAGPKGVFNHPFNKVPAEYSYRQLLSGNFIQLSPQTHH